MGDPAVLALSGHDLGANVLHTETVRLAAIMQRVGRRLKNHIGKLERDGVPDEGTRETLRWYKDAALGLLKEQRERAKLAMLSDAPTLSEEEHQVALAEFRRETMLAMTDGELEKLVAERAKVRGLRA